LQKVLVVKNTTRKNIGDFVVYHKGLSFVVNATRGTLQDLEKSQNSPFDGRQGDVRKLPRPCGEFGCWVFGQ